MKKAFILFFIIWLFGCVSIFVVFKNNKSLMPDMVAVNDAVMVAIQNQDHVEAVNLLTEQLQQEYENMDTKRKNRDVRLQTFLYIYTACFIIFGIGLYLYCERGFLAPFRKLKHFAKDVAAGNLDIPLQMDKHENFGAFTESFDLMRVELKKARENEHLAEKSKKELIASLSHDIKTPIASIQAITELMLVSVKNEKEKLQLERINIKAEQINSLITDMFHATLEELNALNVTVSEIQSTVIPDLIRNADYQHRIKPFDIPDCIVWADMIRLQQVFDNIIGNSYKYADTDIEIYAGFDKNFLIIEIMDFGDGVSDEELPLLFNKFYRGKNAEDKSGYGLGLHITNFLLTNMSGALLCENRSNGFCVKILLQLA